MKNKIGIFAFLFVVITLLPLGTVFAAKPVEMSAILYCEAEIIDSWIAGNNEFSIRELDCVFTGDILGDVERFVTVRVNQKSNSANGPVIPWCLCPHYRCPDGSGAPPYAGHRFGLREKIKG